MRIVLNNIVDFYIIIQYKNRAAQAEVCLMIIENLAISALQSAFSRTQKGERFGPENRAKMAFHRLVTRRSFGVFSFVFNKSSYPRVGVRRKGEFPQAVPPNPCPTVQGLAYQRYSSIAVIGPC